MTDKPIEPLIRLHAYNASILTSEEYEALQREVTALALLDSKSLVLAVLAPMLLDSEWRYHETVEIRKHQGTYPRK